MIEDDANFRGMLALALNNAGYEVVQAENGVDGLRHFKAGPTDLVITDIVMDYKDGIETLIELRKQFPAVPAIAMSGSSPHSALYLKTAKHMGALVTLEKPFRIETLLELIAEFLGPRKSVGA